MESVKCCFFSHVAWIILPFNHHSQSWTLIAGFHHEVENVVLPDQYSYLRKKKRQHHLSLNLMLSSLQQKVQVDSIFQNAATQLCTDHTQYKKEKIRCTFLINNAFYPSRWFFWFHSALFSVYIHICMRTQSYIIWPIA